MDWVTWINTLVGVVGIVVGIIGWRSLSAATKIKNSIKANTVQQAQVINNGLDAYAVIRLSKETTQEELISIVKALELTSNKVDEVRNDLKVLDILLGCDDGENH